MTSVATQKKLKTQDWPIKKPKKTQGQISIPFRQIFGENRTFPGKNQTFPKKNIFLSAKISDDLFLVITFDFLIFYPDFSNFYYFSHKMSDFLQKTNKINVFSGRLKKNQEKPEVLSKTLEKTQGPQKKPKNPRLLRKTQDLGRKPKQWQRWM